MTTKKVDLDQLTNRQMLELERAAGMRFREITASDILAMTATAWVYMRENGMQAKSFDELLDMTPTQLAELIGIEDSDDEEPADADPHEPSPTTP
jgi:hypothetical protein